MPMGRECRREAKKPLSSHSFTVTDESSADSPRGSGLGMAIARRAAIANGGRIFARRRVSGGLEVVIEVPALS
jgi:signal transduction histidine kinase